MMFGLLVECCFRYDYFIPVDHPDTSRGCVWDTSCANGWVLCARVLNLSTGDRPQHAVR